jgi:hypothetical protein
VGEGALVETEGGKVVVLLLSLLEDCEFLLCGGGVRGTILQTGVVWNRSSQDRATGVWFVLTERAHLEEFVGGDILRRRRRSRRVVDNVTTQAQVLHISRGEGSHDTRSILKVFS